VRTLSRAKASDKPYTKASTKATKTYPSTKDIVWQNKNSHTRQIYTEPKI